MSSLSSSLGFSFLRFACSFCLTTVLRNTFTSLRLLRELSLTMPSSLDFLDKRLLRPCFVSFDFLSRRLWSFFTSWSKSTYSLRLRLARYRFAWPGRTALLWQLRRLASASCFGKAGGTLCSRERTRLELHLAGKCSLVHHTFDDVRR